MRMGFRSVWFPGDIVVVKSLIRSGRPIGSYGRQIDWGRVGRGMNEVGSRWEGSKAVGQFVLALPGPGVERSSLICSRVGQGLGCPLKGTLQNKKAGSY